MCFFFSKNLEGGILGCLGRPTPPPGGRAGSENDTLLPLAITHDRPKFLGGQKLSSGNLGGGRIKKQEQIKIKKSDKIMRQSRWGMPNKRHLSHVCVEPE